MERLLLSIIQSSQEGAWPKNPKHSGSELEQYRTNITVFTTCEQKAVEINDQADSDVATWKCLTMRVTILPLDLAELVITFGLHFCIWLPGKKFSHLNSWELKTKLSHLILRLILLWMFWLDLDRGGKREEMAAGEVKQSDSRFPFCSLFSQGPLSSIRAAIKRSEYSPTNS